MHNNCRFRSNLSTNSRNTLD